MADSAALKLGSVISSSITGSFAGLASGMRGALSEGIGFQTMSSALTKGFSSIDRGERARERNRQEEANRNRGFTEEKANEQRKQDQIALAIQKGMAINIEAIQQDVRKILEVLSEKSILEKLGDFLKGLALAIPDALSKIFDGVIKFFSAIPGRFAKVFDDIIDFFKNIPSRIGSVFDDIIDFFKSLPSRITSVFDDIIDFFKSLPGKITSVFDEAIKFIKSIPGKFQAFFGEIFKFFDDFVKTNFPATRAAIAKFFSDLADILKFDAIKGFFSSQLENLKNLFKFDELAKILNFGDIFKAIGTKFDELVKLLGESDIAKAFRRIRNIFAISFAQYADELEELFNNKVLGAIGKIRTSIASLGEKIPTSIDELVDVFKSSKIGSIADNLSTKLTDAFSSFTDYFKQSKIGTLADDLYTRLSGGFASISTGFKESKVGMLIDDITNVFKGLFTDFKSLIKFPSFAELEMMFDLGKNVKTLDEFKYLFGETGIIGKIFTTIGTVTGALNTAGVKVFEFFGHLKDIFSGPLKLLSELSGLSDLGRIVGAVVPFFKVLAGPLAIVFTLIDGIMGAADTKALQETFGTKDVTWRERIAGFFGGVVSGIFGLFDLIGDLFGISTKDSQGKTLQERVFSATAKLTKGIMDAAGKMIDLFVGIVTLDYGAIKTAGIDLMTMIRNSFATLGNVMIDSINWLIDKLPEWMRPSKLNRIAIEGIPSEANKATAAAAVTPAPSGPATGNAPPVSAEAAAMMSQQGSRYTYTASDLKRLGLNVKEGDVQKPNAHISASTIQGAQWVQSNYNGITFTGFNDAYHDKNSPASSHTKGLAFDFVIPVNLASDNEYRKSLANAVSRATGGYVIDEYAYPSAKSTGGHFHVDFGRSRGVKLGTGNYLGEPPVDWGSKSGIEGSDAKFSRIPAPQETTTASTETEADFTDYMYGADEYVYTPTSSSITPVASSEAGAGSAEYTFFKDAVADGVFEAVHRPGSMSVSEALNVTANVTRKEAKRQSEYDKERASLEREFNSELKGVFRPLVQGIVGPAGEVSKQAERQAGRNIVGTYLDKDFKKLGVKIFGKDQGAAIGETFQKLAGVYMDEFIDKALAPALGMESKYLNRSINTYLEGYKKTEPQIKQYEANIAKTRSELEKYKKEKGDITSADIIRAGARKGFTDAERTRLNELNRMNAIIKKNEEDMAKAKAVRKEYKTAAMGDLIYGMTGIATTPRNVIEDIYGAKGAEGLTEDLASIFGAPFAGLFKASPIAGAGGTQSPVTQEVQARRQVNAENVQQTRQVNAENVQAQMQMHQVVQQSQGGMFSSFLNGLGSIFDSGANMFRNALGSARPGAANGSWDVLPEAVSGAVKEGLYDLMDKDIASSGTVIPGAANGEWDMPIAGDAGGSWDILPPAVKQQEGNFLTNLFSGKSGPSTPTSRVGTFATDYLGNMISARIGKSFGGGFTGQIGGNVVKDLAMSSLRGGNFNLFQSLGSNFGIKLGSNASFSDLLGGFNSMGGSMMMNFGSTISNLGANLGSQFMTELGAGMVQSGAGAALGSGATSAMNIGQSLGSVGQVLGPALMSYNLSKMIGGSYSTGLPVNEIAALASMIPGVGPIAGVIGGLVNRAFGRKPKEYKATRIAGNLKFGGSDFKTEADWFQKGGWFRSDKRGTDVTAFAAEDIGALNDAVGSIYKNMAEVSKGLKLDIAQAYNFSKDVKFDVTGLTAEQQQQKWQQVFTEFTDDMYKFTFGAPLETARKMTKNEKGEEVLETYEQTLMRLSSVGEAFDKSLRSMVEMTGGSIEAMFGQVGTQMTNATKIMVATAKQAFIDAAGGLQEAVRITSEYTNLFYTEEEKQAQRLRDANREVTEALQGTGFAFNQITQESFGTLEEIQAMSSDDYMEKQRVRYRQLVDDFVTQYGWMGAAGQSAENQKWYFEKLTKLQDAGSEFLDAAKVAYQQAQQKKAPTPIVYTSVDVGTVGAGPRGELSFDGVGNNIVASSNILSNGLIDSAQQISTTISSSFDTASVGLAMANESNNKIAEFTGVAANTMSSALNSTATTVSAALTTTATVIASSVNNLSSTISGIADGGGGAIGGTAPSGTMSVDQAATAISMGSALSNYASSTFGLAPGAAIAGVVGAGLTSAGWAAVAAHDIQGAMATGLDAVAAAASSHAADMAGGSADLAGIGTDGGGTGLDGGSGLGIGPQAYGGPIAGNKPYIVGEVGPEIFMPNVAGSIIPTHKIIEAVQSAGSLDSQTRNLLENAVPVANPVSSAYMMQQAMNSALNAEREILTSINNSMVNHTVNNVSSPTTSIVTQTSGGVRSDNPIAGAFTRSLARPRMF